MPVEALELRRGFAWCACIDCGKERLVALRGNEPIHKRCLKCAKKRELNPRWKGGRIITGDGYCMVSLPKGNPYLDMADRDGYVMEHRLIMADHLGRCLLSWETVHHRDGVRTNNNLNNLELLVSLQHDSVAKLCGRCPLRQEIRLLRWQIKELTEQLQGRLAE